MKQYLQYTRAPLGSYLLSLPLLALYLVVAFLANLGERRAVINGADALLQSLLSVVGLYGWGGSCLVLAAVAGVAIYRQDKTGRELPFRAQYLAGLLLESTLYACFFGSIVAFLASLILPGPGFLQIGGSLGLTLGQKLATGLGAGFYEELVFRVMLAGSLLWIAGKLGWSRAQAVTGAVLVSSLLFSLFHYVGPGGESFALGSFVFRFVAGVVLAGLFAARGFAVAAWTHALYDVFLILAGKA
ncbi:MAG: CPBP family intramembrane metalloprotease [Armatimonadetes bacterium]|nr:CPBP family intramembrane metalloprotease [Armatimonadota bacterium]